MACQYLKGMYKQEGGTNFLHGLLGGGGDFKQKERRFSLYAMQKFFTLRVVRHWHMLHTEVLHVPSLEVFEVMLDGALGILP